MRSFWVGVSAAVTVWCGIASAGGAQVSGQAQADVRDGDRLFQQNCALCHVAQPYSNDIIGPRLGKNLLRGAEEGARQTIKSGRPGMMPGFQHAMTDAQINNVIAYLLTIDESAPTVKKPLPATPVSHEGTLLLTGNVTSDKGEKMEGVAVSAHIDDQAITATVFTDKDGNYYFPPMASAAYRVWAQAVGYEAGRAQVSLSGAVKRQDFRLKETADYIPQLTGAQLVEALPVDTPQQRRMRDIFLHNCNTCHPIGVTLRNRFDAEGWATIIDTMTRVNGMGKEGPSNRPRMVHFKKDLVAYLTEIRGPGPSSMKFKVPDRPAGASTLPVVHQYDIPSEEFGGFAVQNGTDWSQGTPGNSRNMRGYHDAIMDLDGNIWVTYYGTNRGRSYGRIDTRTGAITSYPVPIPNADGFSAVSHTILRMPDGNMVINLYFTVGEEGSGEAGDPTDGRTAGSIGVIETKTGKIKVYTPTAGMPGVSSHVDFDGKGFLWGSTRTGAVRVDPRTGQWKNFPSPTQPKDGGSTYGVAALPGGGAMWALIGIDKVAYSDGQSPTIEIDVPRMPFVSENDVTPEDQAFYAAQRFGDAQGGPPWQQGPRRLQADRKNDDVWAGGHLGNTLIRVNSKTRTAKSYKVPLGNYAPYMPVVDDNHNVWLGLQGSQTVARFEPSTEKWTTYYWASMGAAPRHLAVFNRPDGKVEVIGAFWGTSAAGRMTMRTERDLEALKSRVASAGR